MIAHQQNERRVIALVDRGEFAIDHAGRIWRMARRHGRGLRTLDTPVRAENTDTEGYLQLRVHLNGRRICASAHRLVWQHVHGDIPDGLTVNHIDGVKTNCRPSNLELATYAEQSAHAAALGLHQRETNGQFTNTRNAA